MAWISWDKLCTPKSQGRMGFKQLKQFNLALLAKQRWRLQVGSDSIMFRVFKACYFPNCDFIHAKVGCNPSFAWRSIMAAQSIVCNGVRWQVGNGRSIQIWQDRWLPTPSTYKVISPPSLLGAEAWVSELINPEMCSWNSELIRDVFLPHEAKVILGLGGSGFEW